MVVSRSAKPGLPFHRLPSGYLRPSMNPLSAGRAGGLATELAKSARLRYEGKLFGSRRALALHLGVSRDVVSRLMASGEVEVVETSAITLPKPPWAAR